MADYNPMVQKAPVANGGANMDFLDLIDGTLVSVQPIVFNTIANNFAIRAPGKYYVFISRLPGRSNTTLQELLWGGYVDGGAQASIVNLECYKPQQLFATVYCDSTPIAGDLIQIWATISPGTHPRGGSSIHYQPPFTGPGDPRIVSLGDPAAGANYATLSVPLQVRWRPKAIFGELITSAVAVNRVPEWIYRDSATNIYAIHTPSSTQGATLTIDYSATLGNGQNWTNNTAIPAGVNRGVVFPLTDIQMNPSHTILFQTINLDAGDNWGPGFLNVEEWAGPSA